MASTFEQAVATSAWTDDSSDQTTSINLDADTTKLIVTVHTKAFTNRAVTGVSWNGSALTSRFVDDDANRTRTEIFTLDSPATGTHNLVIDLSGVCTGVAVVHAISACATGAPETSAAWSFDGTSPDSVTLSSTSTGSIIVGGTFFSSFSGSAISSSNSTRTSTSINADGSYRAGGGTVTMDRTWTGGPLFECTGGAISVAEGAASGAMVGSAALSFSHTATLIGTGALAGSAAASFTHTATLRGAGALVGSTAASFSHTASLQGTGAMVATAALAFTHSAALVGSAPAVGATTITFTPSGTLDSPSGDIVGSTTLVFTPSGTLSGVGALIGATTLTLTPVGSLAGVANLVGSSALTLTGSGTLVGVGALTGSETLSFSVAGTLDAPIGSMAGTATITFTPVGTVRADGSLSGLVTLTFGPAATPSATAAIDGSAALVFSLNGLLIDANAPVVEVAPITGVLLLGEQTSVRLTIITSAIDPLNLTRRTLH